MTNIHVYLAYQRSYVGGYRIIAKRQEEERETKINIQPFSLIV